MSSGAGDLATPQEYFDALPREAKKDLLKRVHRFYRRGLPFADQQDAGQAALTNLLLFERQLHTAPPLIRPMPEDMTGSVVNILFRLATNDIAQWRAREEAMKGIGVHIPKGARRRVEQIRSADLPPENRQQGAPAVSGTNADDRPQKGKLSILSESVEFLDAEISEADDTTSRRDLIETAEAAIHFWNSKLRGLEAKFADTVERRQLLDVLLTLAGGDLGDALGNDKGEGSTKNRLFLGGGSRSKTVQINNRLVFGCLASLYPESGWTLAAVQKNLRALTRFVRKLRSDPVVIDVLGSVRFNRAPNGAMAATSHDDRVRP